MAGNSNNTLALIGNKARLWPVATAAIYLFAVSAIGRISHGAPIVYKFDATISEVQGDVVALNLPFSLAVGQQFQGSVAFEIEQSVLDLLSTHISLPGEPTIPLLEGVVRLSLEGNEYDAAVNFMGVNQGGPVDINNPPPPSPSSSISMYYLSPTDVIPGWGGSLGVGHYWGAGLLLLGPDGTVNKADDLLDVKIWNELTTVRSLGLRFGYPDTVTVRVTVGDFIAVPEPSSGWLAGSLVGVLLLYLLGSKLRKQDMFPCGRR